MKSSYKLFGTIWDGKDSVMEYPALPYDATVPPLGEPRCLFDAQGVRRALPISDLLKIELETDLLAFVDRASNCDELLIELDYCPPSDNPTLSEFYWLRVRQIQWVLMQALHNTRILPMSFCETRGCHAA